MTIVVLILCLCLFGVIGYFFLKMACIVLSFKDSYERRQEVKRIIKNNKDYMANRAVEEKMYTVDTDDTNIDRKLEKASGYLGELESTIANKTINESDTSINKELEPYIKALGLQNDVSPEKIKEAFRIYAKKYHPSYGTEPNEEKYNQIVLYRDILINSFNSTQTH